MGSSDTTPIQQALGLIPFTFTITVLFWPSVREAGLTSTDIQAMTVGLGVGALLWILFNVIRRFFSRKIALLGFVIIAFILMETLLRTFGFEPLVYFNIGLLWGVTVAILTQSLIEQRVGRRGQPSNV